MWIDSEIGAGSRFSFTIEAARPPRGCYRRLPLQPHHLNMGLVRSVRYSNKSGPPSIIALRLSAGKPFASNNFDVNSREGRHFPETIGNASREKSGRRGWCNLNSRPLRRSAQRH